MSLENLPEDIASHTALEGIEDFGQLATKYVEMHDAQDKPWTDGLPDDLRTDDNLEKFKDLSVEDLAKAHLDRPADAVIPETAEGYEFKPAEGLTEENYVEFGKLCHENKIPQETAQVLADLHIKELAEGIEEYKKDQIAEAEKSASETEQETKSAIQKLWPNEAEAKTNMENAQNAFKSVCEVAGVKVDDVDPSVVKGDINLIKIFNVIATKMSEDTFTAGANRSAADKTDAEKLFPHLKG